MPGIVAIIAEPNWPDLATSLDLMLGAITYPRSRTTLMVLPEQGIALGHTGPERVAKPQPGYWPGESGAQVIALVDGEPLDLRGMAARLDLPQNASPATIVAAIYAHGGPEGIEALPGHWTAAVVDHRSWTLTIVNDPFGIRALYRMRATDGAWLVASHPAAILAYPAAKRVLNLTGVADYLASGHAWAGRTVFQDLEMLPPATRLTGHSGDVQVRRYWSARPEPATHASEADLEAVRDLFNRSVYRMTDAGGPYSLALTGGMDARAVLSAMVAADIRPQTVIHCVPGSTDAILSSELARRALATHHFYEVRGEMLPPQVHPGVLLLGGQIAEISVHALCFLEDLVMFTGAMFTGLGADMMRADYAASHVRAKHDTLDSVTKEVTRYYNTIFSVQSDLPALLNPDAGPGLASQLSRSTRQVVESFVSSVPLEEIGGAVFLEQRVPQFWIKGDLTVRWALETRHPFLDRDLLLRAWNLPRPMRLRGLAHRYLITRNAPTLADVPYERDGFPLRYPVTARERWRVDLARLNRQVQQRLGSRYTRVPNYRYGEWLRGPLRSLAADVLLDPRAQSRPYFRAGAVRRFVDEHMAGRDHTTRLAALIALELTTRAFIERDA
jgi:asparagine synthetase B (glutamine-hydrolysing)